MTSIIFDSYFDDITKGNIVIGVDTIKTMFISAAGVAAASKGSWTKRSDVTAYEIAAGGGYSAGGFTATCTPTKDTTNHREDVSLGGASASSSTISAAGCVYYKSRGGASSADELIAMNDFGGTVATTNGTFTLNASTLRIQN